VVADFYLALEGNSSLSKINLKELEVLWPQVPTCNQTTTRLVKEWF